MSTIRIAAYCFIVFSIVFSIFTITRILTTFHLSDFARYRQVVLDIQNHQNPYDNPTTDLTYPPTAFFLFFTVGLIPTRIAEIVWTLISWSALIGTLFILLNIIESKISWFHYFLVYSFAMSAFPVKFTLGMGQVNLILLLLISLCFLFYRQKRHYAAGIVLAIASAIKLTPIILIIFFLKKRALKVVMSTGITLFVLMLLAVLFFGFNLTDQYFREILPSIPTVGNGMYYNQALTGFLARLHIANTYAWYIQISVFTLLIAISFILTKPYGKSPVIECMEYGLFITAMLIGNGFSWQHHFVMLIIPYTALFTALLNKNRKPATVFSLVLISYLLVAYNIKIPSLFTGFSILLLSHVLYGSVLLYFLLVAFLSNQKRT